MVNSSDNKYNLIYNSSSMIIISNIIYIWYNVYVRNDTAYY